MKTRNYRAAVLGGLIAALLPLAAAHAQLGDLLKNGASQSSGGLGSLGDLGGLGSALSGSSLGSASTGNVAGVLQYCIKNNYLGGNNASSVKDSLMGKISGGSPSSDSGYTEGAKGLLSSGNGQKIDLSGGGLQESVTKQVCEKILSTGKSML